MQQESVRWAGLFVFIMYLAASSLYAQEHSAMTHDDPSPAVTSLSESPTIFCPTMTTGQLCSHGTADALKLSEVKRDRWVEAARRYNKAVGAATKQLQEEVGAFLTPEELALVQMWFAEGLNPEINRILATKQ